MLLSVVSKEIAAFAREGCGKAACTVSQLRVHLGKIRMEAEENHTVHLGGLTEERDFS